MITWKIGKAISSVCDVKNSNRAFLWYMTNWQLWGSFLLKLKIEQSGNWIVLFFKTKITLKHLKIVRSSNPRVGLLTLTLIMLKCVRIYISKVLKQLLISF